MSVHGSPGPGGPETGAEVEISTADTPPHQTSPSLQGVSPLTQVPVAHMPQVIQGPQPLSNPPPAPPKLSAQELQLITEAAAKQGPNGTFQCSLCNKNFGYKNGLVRHIRLTHVGEKPYECNICHRRFGYKHILMEHQNLHFGNRPYACTQCDKKFAARSNLIQHRTVHKRPYQCTMCNKRFDKEDQLKKHMYAHPQTMLQCTMCKKSCNNENELKKHIAKVHPNDLNQQAQIKAEPMMQQNGMLGDMHGMSPLSAPGSILQAALHHQQSPAALALGQQHNTEPISPPAGASPDGHAQAPHTPPGHSTPPARAPAGPPATMINERGQRIDAICSQLVTSVSNPVAPHHEPAHTPPTPNHYQQNGVGGMVIKKEHPAHQAHQYTDFDPHHPEHSQSPHPRISSTGSAEYHPGNNDVAAAYSSQELAAARAQVSAMYSQSTQMMVDDIVSKEESQTPALPGIHEMFSRRPTPKLPPPVTSAVYAVTTPLNAADIRGAMNLPHDLPLNLMSPPPMGASSSSTFSTVASTTQVAMTTMAAGAGGVVAGQYVSNTSTPSQTPTPMELTPQRTIAHHAATAAALPNNDSQERTTQHASPALGYPDLDEVLNYYVNQGAIFKCQHCNVVFFERGMFFLHASLHSSTNPFECSICNKVCADRNEFTLHFVNQQHTQ